MSIALGLDIGSNSVGSSWINRASGELVTGTSVFPAGVDESDDKRGDPKNAKRRMTRRTRITLARRSSRKRDLRLKLIAVGLLPSDPAEFKRLLEESDPWTLRSKGLREQLTPHEFGRVLLHLSQRRGALGLKLAELDDDEDAGAAAEDGKVKAAIGEVRAKMREKKAETFGQFIAMMREERVQAITTEDRRKPGRRKGPREYRQPVRNKAGNYEHCADRAMIRDEFAKLWDAQKRFEGPLKTILTDDLRLALDNEAGDAVWKHKGLLFGQRRQSWDLGTLGRCVLEPTERCAPHADMYASRYLVVETVNNLEIVERGKEARWLTPEERRKIKDYLSGPLGPETRGKRKGEPKRSVSVTDLRELMGWGRASKTSQYRFNIESDPDRQINTDWFNREIVHGSIGPEAWNAMPPAVREGINRAILKFDPEDEKHESRLKAGLMDWAGLNESQASTLVVAWKRRPKPDAKRLNMSRRAVRNILIFMDRDQPWPVPDRPGQTRWLTQIEARKLVAQDAEFCDATIGKTFDEEARCLWPDDPDKASSAVAIKRRHYAIGAKGSTARDRHYMRKHLLKKNGEVVYGPDGLPLHEPPPAPLISNPVVRKAIHEVRRHLIEYMTTFARKPDEIYIELAREAKMGKVESDRLLFRNRLRNRIRNDIIREFNLDAFSSTQQRAAVDRVILCVQQRGICPLCGKAGLTEPNAAKGEGCEVAHIVPRASGGHNGMGNIVLAHTKCNRDMARRTPRQFWNDTLKNGFEEGISWVEQIYGDVQRPKPSEIKTASGNSLWACYFKERDDTAKIDQCKKDVKDIQQMTNRQEAATKYAARQVMAYLADAVFEGKGLPERGGDRRIFTTDGMWTWRLRREWGLIFDAHKFKAKGLSNEEEHLRKEKNRGDHHHHAIDAIITALCTEDVRRAWDQREMQADRDGVNTADEQSMEIYRRQHPLPFPQPHKTREDFREAVRQAVFGNAEAEKPICHRPVKRKLIGALHKATQYGPVVDKWVRGGVIQQKLVEDRVTVRQSVLGEAPGDFLKPAHLRLPRPETDEEATERLARRMRVGKRELQHSEAIKLARKIVKSSAFTRTEVDPKPEKGGIVRDIGLRRLLRRNLEARGLNPDLYSKSDLKRSIAEHGPLTHDSGVPIHSAILLWANTDPVRIQRDHYDYATGKHRKLDEPASLRMYDSQNNHHIEIRVAASKKGGEKWSGQITSTFNVAQTKLAKLRAMRQAGVPTLGEFRKLSGEGRAKWKPTVQAIEKAHPLVDRCDNDDKGGRFVMSLCEGEILWMRHKQTGEVGYFVVAKLDKPQAIVVVPHWDARAATERKDAEGKKVPDSKREDFSVTPSDLKKLAPPSHDHAVKVRVTPLGRIRVLERD